MTAPVVLFEDDWILAVNKPTGMAVHPGAGISNGTLNDWVRDYLGPKAVRNDFAASIAHRLDRETSGIVIIAKRRPAMRKLTEAFERREVTKTYLALVGGTVPDSGEINQPLRPLEGSGAAQEAFTAYTVQRRFKEVALIECSPRTGRKHQLRRHLASIKCPVAGDATYGSAPLNDLARQKWGLTRLFLHARSIKLRHPRDESELQFEAPLASDLESVLQKLSA